ncbi:inositol monophosphatase [bacterium]|nr:inositol monophosphatase [bacterium]
MPDLKEFFDLAVEAARKAGRIQREGLGRDIKIRLKGPKNLVTEIDKGCEEAITSLIIERYPEHGILAEEGGARKTSSPYRWIIDPLDGTTNYTHAYPFFCVSIALEENGEIVVGVVYDPVKDEMFCARKREGAWMNGCPVHVSRIDKLEKALVAAGRLTKKDRDVDVQFASFRKLASKALALRIDGAAALDMCYVAIGRFDAFWEYGLKPWDTAAGWLIIKEAGGQVSAFNGGPFDPFGPEVLASNGIIHRMIMDNIL